MISMRDIEEALKPKEEIEPATKLPPEYHKFLEVFSTAQSKIRLCSREKAGDRLYSEVHLKELPDDGCRLLKNGGSFYPVEHGIRNMNTELSSLALSGLFEQGYAQD
ncbi:hypothetical protein L228DRAFT_259011 [Xylona heveae TC161]|uniref:Uncharacterized protein n=1 Tax=Xylona heveae (strain CBS 132557 / TC161) TaxID=1328760 RepID=A0A165J1I2_XYLHT|nr:hypothetical protein L228DRAFT_259011 [Xylona heveae TC161]KZF25616.1 hypothetical protein L228DRAFT_259011 [Xylona heveae TC161]